MTGMASDEEWFTRLCQRLRLAIPLPPAVLDRRIALAFHEAGHAVVDHANGLDVTRVSIDGFEGRAHASASGAPVEAILDGATREAVRPFIQGALAGILAEAMVTAVPLWAHAYADLVFAKDFAEAACDDGNAAVLLGECIEESKRTLTARWSSVVAIANLLCDRDEIAGTELEALLNAQ
jgi:enoyl reductase-like protein